MKVADVMHRGVITCAADASGIAVARIMAAHRIHSAVVTDAAGPPRVVTDADVAVALHEGTLESRKAGELRATSVVLRPEDSLAEALERLQTAGSTHAVVADGSLRPLGIVSVLDLIEAFLRCSERRNLASFHG
jgi:CBS domain-containing protein